MENGDTVSIRGYLCLQDSRGGGGNYPKDSREGGNYPQDSRGVLNPNNPPYIRHCSCFFKFYGVFENFFRYYYLNKLFLERIV